MSSLRRGNAISWEEVRDARPEAMAKDDLFQTLFQAEMVTSNSTPIPRMIKLFNSNRGLIENTLRKRALRKSPSPGRPSPGGKAARIRGGRQLLSSARASPGSAGRTSSRRVYEQPSFVEEEEEDESEESEEEEVSEEAEAEVGDVVFRTVTPRSSSRKRRTRSSSMFDGSDESSSEDEASTHKKSAAAGAAAAAEGSHKGKHAHRSKSRAVWVYVAIFAVVVTAGLLYIGQLRSSYWPYCDSDTLEPLPNCIPCPPQAFCVGETIKYCQQGFRLQPITPSDPRQKPIGCVPEVV